MKSYKKITRQEFEQFLKNYIYVEFSEPEYQFDWDIKDGKWALIEKPNGINEFCYKIRLDNNYCLKVYSSIAKDDGLARDKDADAIRIVPAETLSLKPIRVKFSHIKRMDNWKFNFQERINQILKSLGKNDKCQKCGSLLFLRFNGDTRSNFLGCSEYPKCKAAGISLVEICP